MVTSSPNPSRWRGALKSKLKAINIICVRDTSAIGNRTLGVVLSTLVPIADVGPHTSAYLRVDPARNNQTKGVRWAVDHEVTSKSD
jgi:hypothetical protein